MKLISDDQRREIKRIAQSDELKIIRDRLKQHYMEQWASTRDDDAQARDHYFRMIKAIDMLYSEFENEKINEVIDAHNAHLQGDMND